MKEKIIPIRLDSNVYRQFKAAVALEGKTIKGELEKLMLEYVVRKKNGSKTRNSGAR
jgi:hypothetical protein